MTLIEFCAWIVLLLNTVFFGGMAVSAYKGGNPITGMLIGTFWCVCLAILIAWGVQ